MPIAIAAVGPPGRNPIASGTSMTTPTKTISSSIRGSTRHAFGLTGVTLRGPDA